MYISDLCPALLQCEATHYTCQNVRSKDLLEKTRARKLTCRRSTSSFSSALSSCKRAVLELLEAVLGASSDPKVLPSDGQESLISSSAAKSRTAAASSLQMKSRMHGSECQLQVSAPDIFTGPSRSLQCFCAMTPLGGLGE